MYPCKSGLQQQLSENHQPITFTAWLWQRLRGFVEKKGQNIQWQCVLLIITFNNISKYVYLPNFSGLSTCDSDCYARIRLTSNLWSLPVVSQWVTSWLYIHHSMWLLEKHVCELPSARRYKRSEWRSLSNPCSISTHTGQYLLSPLHMHEHLHLFHESCLLHLTQPLIASFLLQQEAVMLLRGSPNGACSIPVLFYRAWLYFPPGTPALCLCNRGDPAGLACLWRGGGEGCRRASGSCRTGAAWQTEEFPSTPDAPLWTREWERNRSRQERK